MAWRICLGIFLLLLWANRVSAQSDTAVRSELTSLRSRVSRLEAEVRRLSGVTTRPVPSSPAPRIVEGEALGPSDPMFERLATLAIELKEDVRELQKRVTALEKKRG